MGPDESLRQLRTDLYRPGADLEAVRRYEVARAAIPVLVESEESAAGPPPVSRLPRAVVAGVLALVAIAALVGVITRPSESAPPLARGELSRAFSPAWSAWPPTASTQREQLIAALRRPGSFSQLLKQHSDLLPSVSRVVVSAGARAARHLQLDAFSAEVGASSEVMVVWQCSAEGRPFRLQLSTLVQNDTSIVLAPLTVMNGTCSGAPQVVRYRPILGMVPTAAELTAPSGSRVAVLLVE